MKFGELKSKIETCLTESYKNKNLKRDLFVFEELVLKNKNISQVFFLYDELSSNKGLSESVANEFINESITAYENLVNKITHNQIKELKTILSTPKETLVENYNKIKDEVLNKLNGQKEESDSETQETINKVLNKLQTESFNELNYYKLKQLNGGL